MLNTADALTQSLDSLSKATDLESLAQLLTAAARQIAGADGATFAVRDGGDAWYVHEDAQRPLWGSCRQPLEDCSSGASIMHGKAIMFSDIYQDDHLIKTLCVIPVKETECLGAIACYYTCERGPSGSQMRLLQALAAGSAAKLENFKLKAVLKKHELEHANFLQRREEFDVQLQSLAHDLRSPLATMLGFGQLLQTRIRLAGDEAAQRYLSTMLNVTERLSRQIEKVLSLYRLNTKTVNKQYIDLGAYAQEIVECLKVQEPHRLIEVSIASNLVVYADPDLLRLALENLISNSFKFSRKKEKIWIRVDKVESPWSNGEIEIVIEDHGEGFDANRAGRLFQPMVRLHESSEFPGTGLGLASVARVIELHGGRIRAEAEPGLGARFYFTLPQAGANAAAYGLTH